LGYSRQILPFSGSMLRLRCEEEDDNGQVHGRIGPGIVGEMWSFFHNPTSEKLLGDDRVHGPWNVGMPVPRQTFRIGFPASNHADAADKVSDVIQDVVIHGLISISLVSRPCPYCMLPKMARECSSRCFRPFAASASSAEDRDADQKTERFHHTSRLPTYSP
jgi:hypothetical protein